MLGKYKGNEELFNTTNINYKIRAILYKLGFDDKEIDEQISI
jgi:hypothetical protein